MEGTLILSSATWGRYAIEVEGVEGPDLSSGQCLEVILGKRWIGGRVEYNPNPIYVILGPQTLSEVPQLSTRPKAIGGYYVEVDGGGIIGLCVGMEVRLL